jgi:hypothetical protein
VPLLDATGDDEHAFRVLALEVVLDCVTLPVRHRSTNDKALDSAWELDWVYAVLAGRVLAHLLVRCIRRDVGVCAKREQVQWRPCPTGIDRFYQGTVVFVNTVPSRDRYHVSSVCLWDLVRRVLHKPHVLVARKVALNGLELVVLLKAWVRAAVRCGRPIALLSGENDIELEVRVSRGSCDLIERKVGAALVSKQPHFDALALKLWQEADTLAK